MINEFLSEAREYCTARGIKLTTLGQYAVDDKGLFPRLERGGQCYPRTVDRVRAYMADHPVSGPKGCRRKSMSIKRQIEANQA